MTVTYFKRFKMQIDLEEIHKAPICEFSDYSFFGWNSNLVHEHAEAKYSSFRDELDSHVFPCLGTEDGCLKLMNEISCRKGFVADATWLLVYKDRMPNRECCGTIQGIRENESSGSIQNLGIAPLHRGNGLGTQLLIRSLQGFAHAGLKKVNLEVTARNEGALQLYKRVGFEIIELVYKSADLKYR